MSVRKADVFLAFLVLSLLGVALALTHAALGERREAPLREERRRLVRDLHLTDLCLFTEARYTRHPALADRHTPFQDHPLSLEHFPSGSMVAPPTHLRHPGSAPWGRSREGQDSNAGPGGGSQKATQRRSPESDP